MILAAQLGKLSSLSKPRASGDDPGGQVQMRAVFK